ncbi:VCBS domain-containing protein [Bradyrhizobium sp. 1200_D9_N1_2]|uniref:VCBS domain-containing protein n=1 Tax=Bradyrhizobium sp. 1200_D9_N1_2 TaxID=3239014 RepID=UPI003F8BA69E
MATQATGGGSTTSFSNTPQATNDIFTSGLTAAGVSISLTEDNLQPVFFDVMGNDLGGNAKTLFSIDNGINNSGAMSGYSAADLLTQDTARVEATSSDTSLNGAKIWITADGKVGYDASALSAQVAALSAGDFFTDSFIYAIRLGNGTLSWATATVRIAGVNDGPVAAADTSAVKEDTAPNSVSGNVLINDTDADTHDSHSVTAINGSATKVGADVVGTYGTLHLNSDGTYTYTLNNAQANVQALAADQLVYDTFSYTNSDNHGGSCTANLTITVTGTNDAPVITSSAQSGLAAEWADLSAAEGSNTPHTASGAVTFTDVDTLDSHTASFAPQGGGYLGSFTLNTTNHDTGNGGSIGWSFSVADGAIDYLQAGQTLTQKYDVTISDGHGGTAVQTVTVTIVGTNDAPAIISSAQSGLATECADMSAAEAANTPHTASGAVAFTDVDTLDSHTASFAPQGGGYLGSFTLDTTNHDTGNGGAIGWSFSIADGAVDYLQAGQTLTQKYDVTISDGHGGTAVQTVTVTIVGTNDAPVITSATQSGTVSEGDDLPAAAHTATGHVTFSDVDASDTHTLSVSVAAAHGTATVDPDGTWHYTVLDSGAVDALAAGEHLADSFTVEVDDHHGGLATQVVSIDITGTNDAPMITSAAQSGTMSEGDDLPAVAQTATGQVSFSDVDASDTHTLSVSVAAAHGTATVDPDGTWHYTVLDSGAVDALAVGEHLADSFTVEVDDHHGGLATQQVTIDITGTNDAPVITSSAQSGTVSEGDDLPAAAQTAIGQVSFSDVDASDTHTLSVSVAAAHGTATVDPDGTWHYTVLDSGAVDALAAGEHLADSFTVEVDDHHGGLATQQVTIDITGTNDAPVAVADTNSGLEDSTITGTVASNDSDVDDGATLSYSLDAAVAGLALNPDGSYSLDAGNAAYQHLAQGATTDVVANYTVTDEHGATSNSTLTITLTGTNDAPVAVADTDSGLEDSTITGTVASNDSDVDDGATLSYSLDAAVAGLTLNPDGSYSLDAGNAAYQHLAQGATTDVVANYTVTDEHGATSNSTLTITLTGTNDAPVAVADTDSGLEDSTITGTVASNDSDVDDGATLSYSLDAAVAGLTLNPDGSYSLDAGNAAYQHLAQGATTDVVANYTVTDEHGATSSSTLTITLTGTNDAPVAVADTNSGSEDSTITGTVASNDSDIDDGAVLTYAQTSAVAGLALNPDGSYSLDAGNAAYQHLAQGATTDVVANYTVTDEHGATSNSSLTITLSGTNDAPVAVADTDSGLEDSTITGTVASNDSDVDDGAVLTYAQTSAVAGLALNPDGSYSLDAGNAAYQHLAQGATTDVVANYTVTDEHGATSNSTLTITLSGTNDAPVAVADTDSGLEDSTITGTVASNDSDVDDGAILTYAQTSAVAGLALNPDGSYSLDAGNAAYQHLAQGATTDVVANYTVTDEHGATSNSTLTITLSGTNDAPVAVADTDSGLEDSTITGTVASNDSDVDDGAILSYSLDAAVTGLTLNPDGSYSLDAGNAAYQHLAQGATTDVVANYTVTDEHGATSNSTLTITLTGTNDAPVAVADTNSGLEDSTITGTVASNDSDVDDGATLSYSLDAAVAGLALNPDGSYSLDAGNAAYQHLAQGATTDVVANYTVTDEHGATSNSTLTITLTGTNDAPVAVADTDSGLEDSTITGTVASNDSDVDDGATLSYSLDAAVAGLTLNPDGSYSLDAGNAAYQHLAQGATTDVVANYTVTDEHGASAPSTLTITLTGTNDAPVAVADTDSGLEDSTITGTVASNDSDVDDGAILSYSLDAAVAGLALNPDGSYSLDAGNAAYQHLAQGATTDVVANYTVTDEHGATSNSTLTITLTGTNDAPVAVADTNSGLEDSTITGTVASNDSDVDDGATLSYSLDAAVAGLALNPDGSYSLDAGNAAYQHLAQGATTDVVANYTVTDEHGATSSSTLTITLTGTNDAPVAVADTNSGSEDSTITGTVASNDSDVDDGAVLTYAQTSAVAGLALNPDGSYSLDAGNAAYQHLAQGATTDVVANYTVTDEHGATSNSTLTITLTGTNDAPVAVADTDSGLEDSTITGTVASNDSDVDDGATLSYSLDAAVAGLTLNPDGSYSLDAANAAYQHLAQGATTDVVANYTVTDEHGASAPSTLTITLTGTNDAPVLNANGGSLPYTENQAATAINTVLTASDVDSANLTGATVSITANFTSGQDVLGFSNQNGITGSYNASTGVLTLTGSATVAQYQAALESVTYFNSSDNPSGTTRTISYQVDDGQTANHASNSVTSTVAVTPVNDAPVVVAGHTLNYTENQAATAIDPALTLSDVDSANLSSATVQITGNYVTGQDVLGFTNQNGITGSFNAATGTLTLTGSSSVANYQTALDSVTYLNTSDNPSGVARTVTIITNDGTANSVAVTDTINVTPVNDAPVVVAGHTLSYTENQAATAIDPALTVSDVDSANLASATVQITGDYVTGQDVLGFTNQNGITGSFNAATGTLTLTGSSSVANYQTALDSVTYLNTSDNPSGVARTVTIITNDGTANSVAVTDTINVTPVNDAPVGVNDTGSATEAGGTGNGTAGSNATGNVLTNDTDVDNTNASLVVSAIRTGAVEGSDTAGTLGSSLVGAHGTLTLNANGSYTYVVNDSDSAVQALNSGQTITDSFNYAVKDPGNLTDTAVLTVTINGANDAPVNTVPGTQEVVQNTNVTFNGAKLISISDVDVGAGTETVTLSVAHGTLTLSGTTGLSFTTGDGTTDATMTFSGTAANINNALNGLLYNPTDTFVGADTLTITTTDQGGLSDSDTVTINQDSPNPGTLTTSSTDVIFYASGTNTVNATNLTLNGTDSITGGTGTDTLIVTGGSPGPFTFGNGVGNLFLTNFEVFKLVDTNSGNHTDNVTFLSTFQNNGALTVDATGIGGNGKLNLDASAVTSGAFIVIGGDSDDTLKTGSGDDTLTGGLGNDTLTGGAGNDTFNVNSGTDSVTDLSGNDVLVISAGATANATVTAAFTATSSTSNAGTANLSSNGFAVDLSAATGANGFTVTNTGAAAAITGSAQNDALIGGSGNDTLAGGSGADSITGGSGADTMTGGAGSDTFVINSGQSLGTVGGSGDAGTISGYDAINDFATTGTNDILDLPVTNVTANTAGTNGTDSTLTISGQTVKSHAITNGVITFDDANAFASALTLTSTANVAAVVQYLHNNDIATGAGAAVAFVANIAGTAHSYVFEQVGTTPNAANDILVDLVGVTLTNISQAHLAPAGIAGEAINLGLTNPVDHVGTVSVSVSGIPAGWTLSEGTDNGDGTWSVQTNDVTALTITTLDDYAGAVSLHISQTWTDSTGGTGLAMIADNVEAYGQGSPIFALSGDDNLTGSTGDDLFVFSQPIGHDVIYSFDAASDQIDLIGYANFTGFGDIQAHMANDAAGDAVITLADGQSITLNGVDASSLTADDFVFDHTPVTENPGHMVISDGAILPLSGIIDNTGTIELNSTGNEADLQLIELGITLQGGGHVELTDSSENVITGTVADVTLTNVDNTIAGAGHLGDGVMTLVNEGTIIATGTNSLDIDTGTNAITNSGTFEATGAGGLVIHSDVINTGVLWANDGDVTIDGNVSGNGSALISGTATLAFAHASAENTTFAAGATGTLILGDSFNFSGTVSGMTADDHIDLLDFNFASAPTLNYTPNADISGGTLSITDGAHTANIALLGTFDPTGFQIEADKTTGTLVSYHDFHLA